MNTEREAMSEKGTLYFFTGLAGAGKSTIGGLFYCKLRERKPDAVLMDGDQRRVEYQDHDYSTDGRKRGAKGNFLRCHELTEQGHDVVCCSISMYSELREWNRKHFENYKEIYLKVSMDTLIRRDKKGLYSSDAKQVVGVDLPWDEPETPDVVIENDGQEAPEEIVARLERIFFCEERSGAGCTGS